MRYWVIGAPPFDSGADQVSVTPPLGETVAARDRGADGAVIGVGWGVGVGGGGVKVGTGVGVGVGTGVGVGVGTAVGVGGGVGVGVGTTVGVGNGVADGDGIGPAFARTTSPWLASARAMSGRPSPVRSPTARPCGP